jgi:hypothetical protein
VLAWAAFAASCAACFLGGFAVGIAVGVNRGKVSISNALRKDTD